MKHTKIIEEFFTDSLSAIKLLYKNKLYSQLLIVMLATIDSFGLLDASDDELKASGKTFKLWVKKYFMRNPGIEYNEVDLWAYRCALVHTHTSQSALSKNGGAREILFYSGDKFSKKAREFEIYASQVNDDRYVAASIEETVLTFLLCCQDFSRDLSKKCVESEFALFRIEKILGKKTW